VQIPNEASNQLRNSHMSQVFEGFSTLSGKSGEIREGDQTYIATVESEPATGTIIVMQDITYVKQLEEERMRFVHALSHDLRGPLTSIRGYASLVEARGNLNENQLEYLQAIVRGTTRLSDMIGHLLDIAKLRDDPKENFGPFDLMEAIAMAAEDVKGAAEVRHITIQKKYTGQPYWINGDKRRLHRSVLNLIDNAIKYSPENTTVSVALSFSEEHVRISVKDQGYGIPEEDIPRLFNRFYRGSQETSKLTGAGLGLEMVRLTVQAHDGTIEIKSEVDKGTEFIIILPGKLRVDAP
ncbi:MAG: sensor histidine kinase, partial [Anaerolineae bacterium]